jgi:hypothetical protein
MRDDWELYRRHREHFTQAVLTSAPTPGGRLCVLGAGKCNDLDLEPLAERFSELHLVDLDPSAVASAVSPQPAPVRQKVVPHAPVDLALLTGKRADKWKRKPPTPSELDEAAQGALRDVLRRLPGPFDLVVGACLLTQLGFALSKALGEHHPLLGPLRLATVRLHLRTLLDLTAPGGSSLFVSDLASSTHYPLAELPADADLERVLEDVVSKRAFYHLAEPRLVGDLLEELGEKAPERVAPWLWTGPLERTYLVYGYRLSR